MPYARRTIQHSNNDAELICIHDEENIAPILNLVEVTNATRERPICIRVMHLVAADLIVGEWAIDLGLDINWVTDGGCLEWVGTLMLLEDFSAADRWICHGLEARIGAALMSSRCCLIGRCLLVGCDVDLTPSIRAAMGDGFLAPIGARGHPPGAGFMAWTARKWSALMKSTGSWTRWGLPFFGPDRISAADLRSDGFLDWEDAGSGISDSECVVDDRSGAADRGCRRRFVDVAGAVEEGGPCGLLEWRSDGVGHGSSLGR
ncbi:hypothetical protein ACLOJK_041302 [Asimina triloba]